MLRTICLKNLLVLVFVVVPSIVGTTTALKTPPPAAPRVFLFDARQLQATKQRIQSGDKSLEPALSKLERDAQKALTSGPFSVVTKDATPPSGDKHDYMSQAPYFWPDPKSANGLPYIRRDGERNPEINKITDHRSLDQVESSVETLALAYYFKGDEAYATKAAQLLRTFFLDTSTRMNPNLQYAQFIPGVNTGRGIGLIETRGLTQIVDDLGLLAGSKALTETDRRGLEDWYTKFLQWMLKARTVEMKLPPKTITERTTICRLRRLLCFSTRSIWPAAFCKLRERNASLCRSNPTAGSRWSWHAQEPGVTAWEILMA